MRAKKIYESSNSILIPKSEEEILSHLEELSPDKLLLKSSQIGFLPGVKRALERGASVHAQDDLALCWASEKGHKDVVELLLKAGANVHARDDYALRWAAEYGHKSVVELLLKAGAKPNKQIWELAKRKGFLELLKKYGYINESIEDILKPKSQEDIIK